MEIKELFKGIAVIIDDEIDDTDSEISKIKNLLQNKNIPVITYKEIPDTEIIPALAYSSFIIVDWDYTRGILGLDIGAGERVSMPPDYKENQEKTVIDFLKALLNGLFVPVFLFTSRDIDSIKKTLEDNGLWQKDENRNRIFIKDKKEILIENNFFNTIENWLRGMPPAYVLKLWELQARKAKNSMFLDMYNRSPYWVEILWNLMKKDAIEYHHEFGEFITRSLCNRMEKCEFEEEIISGANKSGIVASESDDDMDNGSEIETVMGEEMISPEELQRILEGERFFTYKRDMLPKQFYTGDVFKKDDKYYLNIRAQCDLARKRKPDLYVIEGKSLESEAIYTNAIQLTKDCQLDFGNGQKESLVQIEELCADTEKLKMINEKIRNHGDKVFLRCGSFIEKANKVIVGCIAGEKAIQFTVELKVMKCSELKGFRIGRLLPPYITRIQQRCAQHIIREGVMRIPQELYE